MGEPLEWPLPRLGLGLGWRPELAHFIECHAGLGFVELLAEHFDPHRPLPATVERLRDRGVRFVLHSLSLSLGGPTPPEPQRLDRLALLAEQVDAVLVSDHVCFTRAGGLESGHLLPVPHTHEMLDILVENVSIAHTALPVPLALENIATLFEWPAPELDEATLLAELLRRTHTYLLLDLANLHANARNLGWDPRAWLERLPLEQLAYVHLARGHERGGHDHDTHAHPVPQGPLELLTALCERTPLRGALLEGDDHFPPEAELEAELDAITRLLPLEQAHEP